MAIIKCPECGHQVSDKAATCPSCGVGIAGKVTPCPECGAIVFNDQAECPVCHCPIEQKNVAAQPSKTVLESPAAVRTVDNAASAVKSKESKKKPLTPWIIAFVIALSVYFFKYLPISNWGILPIQIVVGMVVCVAICRKSQLEEYNEVNIIIRKSINRITK